MIHMCTYVSVFNNLSLKYIFKNNHNNGFHYMPTLRMNICFDYINLLISLSVDYIILNAD